MGDLEKRLRNLEGRAAPPPRARPGSVTLADLRALETHIKRLESGAGRTSSAPVVESVEPDEETAAIVRKIEWLERLEQARERRTRGT